MGSCQLFSASSFVLLEVRVSYVTCSKLLDVAWEKAPLLQQPHCKWVCLSKLTWICVSEHLSCWYGALFCRWVLLWRCIFIWNSGEAENTPQEAVGAPGTVLASPCCMLPFPHALSGRAVACAGAGTCAVLAGRWGGCCFVARRAQQSDLSFFFL